MADLLAELQQKHLKLAENMRKLRARHDAALREISFLRARLAQAEPHAPSPAILSGFPEHYPLPRVARTRITHWKEARERLLWSGLTRDQALHLELSCLLRLAQTPMAAHFPGVLQIDLADGRFELTDQGQTLKALAAARRPLRVRDPEAQIDAIVTALAGARVVHLDMHADGRNLCLDATGRLSLIDFDIAAVDEVAMSGNISERLHAFHVEGGYASLKDSMRSIVARLTAP